MRMIFVCRRPWVSHLTSGITKCHKLSVVWCKYWYPAIHIHGKGYQNPSIAKYHSFWLTSWLHDIRFLAAAKMNWKCWNLICQSLALLIWVSPCFCPNLGAALFSSTFRSRSSKFRSRFLLIIQSMRARLRAQEPKPFVSYKCEGWAPGEYPRESVSPTALFYSSAQTGHDGSSRLWATPTASKETSHGD